MDRVSYRTSASSTTVASPRSSALTGERLRVLKLSSRKSGSWNGADVRFESLADIAIALSNVRFTPHSGGASGHPTSSTLCHNWSCPFRPIGSLM
jgi:hypothetical protein